MLKIPPLVCAVRMLKRGPTTPAGPSGKASAVRRERVLLFLSPRLRKAQHVAMLLSTTDNTLPKG